MRLHLATRAPDLFQQGITNIGEKEHRADIREQQTGRALLDEDVVDISSSLAAMRVPVHAAGGNPLCLVLLHGISTPKNNPSWHQHGVMDRSAVAPGVISG